MPVKAEVGAELDSQCGRCHDATKHKVLTQDDKGRAKRCECLVCGAKHLWRKPTGKEDFVSKRKTKEQRAAEAAAKAKVEAAATFEAVIAEVADQEATDYSIRGSFSAGQRLRHKKFGEGVVTKVVPPGRIEVCFREGTRSLVMNR